MPMKPGIQIPEVVTLHKAVEMDFILIPSKTNVLPQVRTLIHFVHLKDLIGMNWLTLVMNVQAISPFMIRSKKFVEFVVINKHSMSIQNNVLLRRKMWLVELMSFTTIKQNHAKKEVPHRCVLLQPHTGTQLISNVFNVPLTSHYSTKKQDNVSHVH